MTNSPITDSIWKDLNGATSVQLVYFPELGLEFFQWLLRQANQGLLVEVIIGFPNTLRNTILNPGYFQRLIQAGGKVFVHPDRKPLRPVLIIDDQCLLLNEHLKKESKYQLEKIANQAPHLKAIIQEYKSASLLPDEILPNGSFLDDAESKSLAEVPLLSLVNKPIQIRFTSSANWVAVYEHFELFWEVEGANEIIIQPLLGQVPAKGIKLLSAEQSTEFTLTARNGVQTLSSVVKINVDPGPYLEYLLIALGDRQEQNLILHANANTPDQYGVAQGQTLQLSWRTINTTELTLDGDKVDFTGSKLIVPKGLNVYNFYAKGSKGTLSKSIIINALAPDKSGVQSLSIPNSIVIDKVASLPPLTTLNPQAPFEKPEIKPIHTWEKASDENTPRIRRPLNLSEFLWFCSGASRETLIQCPGFEQNKYAGIGATVLFTGLLAALSGGYALYVAFRTLFGALLFGLLWGAAIFNLDRLIVSSIKKENGIRQQVKQSIPRILLALALSVVIAKPMEVRIFQPEIEEILASEKAGKIYQTEQQFLRKIKAVESKIGSLKNETQASFQVRENLYQEYRCECDGTCGTKKLGRGSECARKEAKYLQANQEYQDLKSGNDQLIAGHRNEIKSLVAQSSAAQLAIKNRFSEGLVARIAAANQLPFWPSFFITLLIFLIEIAPVLSKILIPAGPYDHALKVQEDSFALAQNQFLNQQTVQTNQLVDIQEKQKELEMEQQLERNREILRIIAGAQIQLVQDQVKRWMDNERNKMKKG